MTPGDGEDGTTPRDAVFRALSGLAAHRDERLREHLLARHRLSAPGLQDAELELQRRRRCGERVLLEDVLLARREIDEGDVARALVDDPEPAGAGPRYELGERLGEGATAVVYRARDRKLGRFVALKVFKSTAGPGFDGDPAVHEGAALARLRHANLVTVLDAGVMDGHAFLATEWVDGVTFDELLATRRRSLRELVALLAAAADGLAEAHRHGVVHRDVKPQNVLVDELDRPKVCDFGFALASQVQRAERRARPHAGTPRFMAPEQWRGEIDAIGPPADVHGLGAMLYQLLVGAPPFSGVDGAELERAVLDGDPVEPQRILRVDRDLSAIATKALARLPQHRYPDAGAFADELRAWLDGRPILARTRPWPAQLARALRRRPLRTAAAVGAACALVLAGVVAVLVVDRRALRDHLNQRMQAAAELGLEAAIRLRRAGDLDALEALGARITEACSAVLAEFPNEAVPHYVLGRMARAGLRFQDALRHQESAVRAAPTDHRVRYELGMLRLQFAFGELRRRQDDAQREGLWRGAVGWARARRDAHEVDPVKLDDRLVTEAIGDLRAAATPFALALASALEARDGPSGEHLVGLAGRSEEEELFAWLAMSAAREGDHAAAIRWSSEGHDRDRGYVPHLVQRAESRFAAWERTGERSAAAFEAEHALIAADLEAACAVRAASPELRERCAIVWLLLGAEARRLRAPSAKLCEDRAITLLELAAGHAPERVELRHGLATALIERARTAGRRDQDVAADLTAAERELEGAIESDPSRPGLWESLGHVRLTMLRRTRGGAERLQMHARACSAFEGAAALALGHFGPQVGIALCHLSIGRRDLASAVLESALARFPHASSVIEPMLERLRR